jgi:hypothetical protein
MTVVHNSIAYSDHEWNLDIQESPFFIEYILKFMVIRSSYVNVHFARDQIDKSVYFRIVYVGLVPWTF